ncbi:unnamed protein product [Lactuca virosa]|uniref:Dilute domain-containing protein n=1 Tax=Lactuca virosa TaxID=75947 RepID=A0AAU9NKW4_9ASTR|nr:unnamed protein product [Lactuca virosa]
MKIYEDVKGVTEGNPKSVSQSTTTTLNLSSLQLKIFLMDCPDSGPGMFGVSAFQVLGFLPESLILLGSCVTTDEETSQAAKIMLLSVIPFTFILIPGLFGANAFPVSVLFFIVYFIYQVFEPSIQKRRLSYVKHEHLVVDILKHLQEHTADKIINEDGSANLATIKGILKFHVPPVIIHKVFAQVYSYIDAQLFNSLLMHKECCTLGNGEYVKSGLSKLEAWCTKATADLDFWYEEINSAPPEVRLVKNRDNNEIEGFALIYSIQPSMESIRDSLAEELVKLIEEVIVSLDDTIILHGGGDKKQIEERCEELRSTIENSSAMFEKEKTQERLSKLSGGVAVFKVGGASKAEVGERKDRVTDALNATRAFVQEGIVLDTNADQKRRAKIVKNALKAPTCTIVSNVGGDVSRDSKVKVLLQGFVLGTDSVAMLSC